MRNTYILWDEWFDLRSIKTFVDQHTPKTCYALDPLGPQLLLFSGTINHILINLSTSDEI